MEVSVNREILARSIFFVVIISLMTAFSSPRIEEGFTSTDISPSVSLFTSLAKKRSIWPETESGGLTSASTRVFFVFAHPDSIVIVRNIADVLVKKFILSLPYN